MRRFTFFLSLFISLYCCSYAQAKPQHIKLADHGIRPNTGQNIVPLLQRLLLDLYKYPKQGDAFVLHFESGRYDFFPTENSKGRYFISNHDQEAQRYVGIDLSFSNNITLEGHGADLIFHGRMLPLTINNSANVRIRNLQIDFETPHITQIRILENDTLNHAITYATAEGVNYRIADSTFIRVGEGWENRIVSGIAFDEKSRHILYNSGDLAVGTRHVAELAPGKIKAFGWKNKSLVPGTVIAMRGPGRPSPGIFVYKAKDIFFENVKIHYAEGMGLLAQVSENISLDALSICLRGEQDSRYFTTQADATHFSGCKGDIIVKNGLYEGMMDDAINVHGTYLKIIKRVDDHTLVGRYMHGQSYGFDWGNPRDTVQFILSKSMDHWSKKNSIESIKSLEKEPFAPMREFQITFIQPIDSLIDPSIMDLAMENLTWTPRVQFSHNTIRNNRARGALFSSPRKTLVTNNIFDHTSGSAIVLCGDSNGWYESGACQDITISNNTFINALSSLYQFTNAVISIYPEIPNLQGQQQYFHGGIQIVNNKFYSFDKPIVYAKSVDGLRFAKNKIIENKDFPAFHPNQQRLKFDRVKGLDIKSNKLNGKKMD